MENITNHPVLNLTSFLTNPLGEEIWIMIMSLVSIFLILWLLSRAFNLKRQNYKIAFFIAVIISLTSFTIRSISIVFSLMDSQKPYLNLIAIAIEIILLFVLVAYKYQPKKFDLVLMGLIVYVGKWMIMGIIAILVILFFTNIPQSIANERSNYGTINEIQGKINFSILEPTYIPAGYVFDNVQLLSNNSIVIHYDKTVDKKYFLISLGETFVETKKGLENYYLPSGEKIIINNEEGILSGNPLGRLTWYSQNLKLLFSLSTGTNSDLNKEEMIKIVESINSLK